ncbi:putative DNA helicase chromatin regulator PHD family [Helianthus anomalus]
MCHTFYPYIAFCGRLAFSYVETLSSEGSELASKCLRIMDWSLLDSLTWPVLTVQYLTTMRYTEGQEWKEFYVNVWEKDYYTLSTGSKLAIMQLLCDDASTSAERRTDRQSRGNRNRPRFRWSFSEATSGDDIDEDGNSDECRLCSMDGTLICCDICPSSYHSRCIGMMKLPIPEGEWYCPECTINRIGPVVTKTTPLRGAEFSGLILMSKCFLGSCDHLLVMKSSGSHIHYYSSVDIPKVLQSLTSSAEYTALYLDICKGILQYWEIPENIFSIPDPIGIESIDDKSVATNAQDAVITAENGTVVAECDSKGCGDCLFLYVHSFMLYYINVRNPSNGRVLN